MRCFLSSIRGREELRQGKIEAGELWRAEKLRSAVALLLLLPPLPSPAISPAIQHVYPAYIRVSNVLEKNIPGSQ
jgi:hypothetical protein